MSEKRFYKSLCDISEKKPFLISLMLLTIYPTMPYLLPVELAFSISLFWLTDPTLSPLWKKIHLSALCGTALAICEWKSVEKHFKTQNAFCPFTALVLSMLITHYNSRHDGYKCHTITSNWNGCTKEYTKLRSFVCHTYGRLGGL